MLSLIKEVFLTVVYEPLYNSLVFLIDTVPGHNIGIAVILLTIIVRILLYPSSKKAIVSQIKLQEVQPEVEEINKKYKDNAQERGRRVLTLYRDKKINPFAPLVPLLIQLPIVFCLYYIFTQTGLPNVKAELLYSFVKSPEFPNTNFWLFDVTEKSLILAVITGISQFFQAFVYQHLTKRPKEEKIQTEKDKKPSFQADFQKSMNIQMLYVFPVFVAVISYQLTAVAAIYWTTTNLFSIMQELITRRSKNGRVGTA